jgi:hypothetical protein
MAVPFSQIPILPLTHALSPATKPQFLASLRHALLNVGFLYLSETGLPETLVEDVKEECRKFFEELPIEEKEAIEMKNCASFLGWSRVSVIFLVRVFWRLQVGGRAVRVVCTCLVWEFGVKNAREGDYNQEPRGLILRSLGRMYLLV